MPRSVLGSLQTEFERARVIEGMPSEGRSLGREGSVLVLDSDLCGWL